MKKIIPALALLLISAVVLSTASFAWFSMNTTVKATGMQVTAKSDSVYLIIGNSTDTLETMQAAAGNKTSVAVAEASLEESRLKPSAWKQTSIKNAGTGEEHTGAVLLGLPEATATVAQITDATKWYKASAAAVTASTAKEYSGENLTAFTGYVTKYSFNLALAKGSNPVPANKLTVSTSTWTKTADKTGDAETIAPIKAIVVCGNNWIELSSTTTSSTDTLNAAAITADGLTAVDVYVYYDGNDSAVYTNNIANLEGAKIDITFSVSVD